jgi:hypothetical protein
MGGFCTPSYSELPSAQQTVSGTEIPSWVAEAGRTAFSRAAEIADSPYPLYEGQRTAMYGEDGTSRLTEDELQGMGILREGAESYLPYMNRANEVADTLGAGYDTMSREELLGDPFSMESAQPFMDIYQSSMDPAVREIEEQTALSQNAARARAAQGGGAFGSRLGLVEAATAGEGAQAAGDLRAQAAREGLGFAADRFDTERQARFGADTQARQAYETNEASRIQQMNAYQEMAPMIGDLQNQAAAGLITAGEARRRLDQQALDLAYADYLDQKMYPQEMLNFTLGALSGTPYNTINRSYTTGSQMTANPSLFGQTIAGMGGLASAYKLMNS